MSNTRKKTFMTYNFGNYKISFPCIHFSADIAENKTCNTEEKLTGQSKHSIVGLTGSR